MGDPGRKGAANRGAVPGTSSRRALGTDPDLEKMARKVRRAGGKVEVDGNNHLLWTFPDGTSMRTGLTMHQRSIKVHVQSIRKRLDSQG